MADRLRIGVERATSVYGGNAALRGVKININRTFTSTEFSLPRSVRECTFNKSDFYYNFSKERDIMQRARERERARVTAVADAAHDSTDESAPLAASQIYESERGGDVLQPTACTANATPFLSAPPVQGSGLTSFSEFEDRSSNPFEDMELQTIDDMGELRTILQPDAEDSSKDIAMDSSETQSHDQSTANHDTHRLIDIESRSPKPVPRPRLRPPATGEMADRQASSPVPRPRVRPSHEQTIGLVASRLPPGAKPTALQVALQSNSLSESEPPPYPGPPLTSSTGSFSSNAPAVESFSSPSDLPPPYSTNEATPPPIPPRLHAHGNDRRQHGIPQFGLVRNHQTHGGWKKEDLRLTNPYHSLNLLEKAAVDDIVTMGFPTDRVARCVKRLGTDKKKVIDFQLDVLKIAGMPFNYTEDSVEVALTNNKGVVEKTLDILKMVSDLKELGFPEKTIHEALHSTGNDKEKAIDYIISHS